MNQEKQYQVDLVGMRTVCASCGFRLGLHSDASFQCPNLPVGEYGSGTYRTDMFFTLETQEIKDD